MLLKNLVYRVWGGIPQNTYMISTIVLQFCLTRTMFTFIPIDVSKKEIEQELIKEINDFIEK